MSGRDNMIHIFDTSTMEPVSSLSGHACDVLFCRASSDRAYAISGDSDGDVFVWNASSSEPMLRLQVRVSSFERGERMKELLLWLQMQLYVSSFAKDSTQRTSPSSPATCRSSILPPSHQPHL